MTANHDTGTVRHSRRRIAVTIATVIALIGLFEGANVTVDHLNAADFPDHAKFHAALGGLYLLGLSIVLLILAWGPVRRGASGARLPFAVCILAIPLGALIAVLSAPDGSPGQPHTGLAVGALLAGIVAVLAVARA